MKLPIHCSWAVGNAPVSHDRSNTDTVRWRYLGAVTFLLHIYFNDLVKDSLRELDAADP